MEYESHKRPWWEYLKFYTMFIAILGSSMWLIYIWRGGMDGLKTGEGVDVDFAVSNSDENPKAILVPFLESLERGDFPGAMEHVSNSVRPAISARLRNLDTTGLNKFEQSFRLSMAEKGGFADEGRYVISGRIDIEIAKEGDVWKISKLDY